MPYFNNISVLFIHIPKTGGTSVEKYFSSKYSIPLNNDSLYGTCKDINISLQHMTYNDIVTRCFKYTKKIQPINSIYINKQLEPNIKIITIVRNPYTRIVSDLFHFNLITINSTKEQVYAIIINYTNTTNKFKYDNHNIPQYNYILDDMNIVNPNIHIMKTETLTEDMIKLGYTDFNIHENTNKHNNNINYYNYFNQKSIMHINKIYKNDFEYFNYTIL